MSFPEIGLAFAPEIRQKFAQKQDWEYLFLSIMNQLRYIQSITLIPVRNRKVSFYYKYSRHQSFFEEN